MVIAMVWRIFEVVERRAKVASGEVNLEFNFKRYKDDFPWHSLHDLALFAMQGYRDLTYEEVRKILDEEWNNVRNKLNSNVFEVSPDYVSIYIKMKNKNKTKRAIREATRAVEEFIRRVEERLEEIANKKAIDDWLYDTMEYDPEKGKFIPSE